MSEKFLNVAQAAAIAHTAVRELQRRRGNMKTRSWQQIHFARRKEQVNRVRYLLRRRRSKSATDPFVDMDGIDRQLFVSVVSSLRLNIISE